MTSAYSARQSPTLTAIWPSLLLLLLLLILFLVWPQRHHGC
jgi:hypothetical protein